MKTLSILTVAASMDTGSVIYADQKGQVFSVIGNNTIFLESTDEHLTVLTSFLGRADDQDPVNYNEVTAIGNGKETVTGGGAGFNFTGGSGHYVVNGGDAASSTISGGSGGGIFTGGYFTSPTLTNPDDGTPIKYGSNVITAGLLGSTLVGAAYGTSLLIANGQDRDVLMGVSGQDTLSGGSSTASNIFEGNAKEILAGSGNDTLIGGFALNQVNSNQDDNTLSTESLTGGSGHDQFRFISGEGLQFSIQDFTSGTDKVDLHGFSETAQQIVASATVAGGSTFLAIDGNTTISLLGVAHLSAKDFTFSGS